MRTLLLPAVLACLGTAALADGHRDLRPVNPPPAWKAECGACHVAYPPALLPAASWQRLMGGLERHFGENAALDPATAKALTAFLVSGASDRTVRKGGETAPLRITETRWFQRQHDEIAPATWKRSKVGGPANCSACHPGAEEGDFNEHRVRIPK